MKYFIPSVGLTLSLLGCTRDDVRVYEHAEFMASTSSIPAISVEYDGQSYDLKIYGKSAADEQVNKSPGRIYISILSPSGEIIYYPFFSNRVSKLKHDYSGFNNDAAYVDAFASKDVKAYALPIYHIAPPGTFGSSGKLSQMRELVGVELLNAAIDQLKESVGAQEVYLHGPSASGVLLAGLLEVRQDVGCAVIAAAPVDFEAYQEFSRRENDYTGSTDVLNPIERTKRVLSDVDRKIVIVADPEDSIVPYTPQVQYAAALQDLGHNVIMDPAEGSDPKKHNVDPWAKARLAYCDDFQ